MQDNTQSLKHMFASAINRMCRVIIVFITV
jgi:hypothetical protein